MSRFRLIVLIYKLAFTLQLPHVIILNLILKLINAFYVQIGVYVPSIKYTLKFWNARLTLLTYMIFDSNMLAYFFLALI